MNCPLTGKPCDLPKTIHVTDISKDYLAEKSFSLCSMCGDPLMQKELSKINKPGKYLQDVVKFVEKTIKSGFESIFKSLSSPKPPISVKTCSQCGYTINDLLTKPRLGCGNCYLVFREEILPVLQKIHKATKHKGKTINSMSILKKSLEEAIKNENYEEANKLKLKIKELKE